MSNAFLPEGWGVYCLEDPTSFVGRGQSPSYIDEDFGVTAINQKCVRNGSVTTDDGRPHNPRIKVKQDAI
ncbi:MAG TPA: hypothetical protein ENK06_07920, partial [Gammaproteobacteria bacterium]|nr:hypothetical protein [Gammaproteobacteria bacterium]